MCISSDNLHAPHCTLVLFLLEVMQWQIRVDILGNIILIAALPLHGKVTTTINVTPFISGVGPLRVISGLIQSPNNSIRMCLDPLLVYCKSVPSQIY